MWKLSWMIWRTLGGFQTDCFRVLELGFGFFLLKLQSTSFFFEKKNLRKIFWRKKFSSYTVLSIFNQRDAFERMRNSWASRWAKTTPFLWRSFTILDLFSHFGSSNFIGRKFKPQSDWIHRLPILVPQTSSEKVTGFNGFPTLVTQISSAALLNIKVVLGPRISAEKN